MHRGVSYKNLHDSRYSGKTFLDPGKNIKGAVNVMREVARKRAVHGAGCVPPEEGFRIVDEYFGITEEMKSRAKQDQDTINILDLI